MTGDARQGTGPGPGDEPGARLDRPLLGICLMLGFCILAPVADGVAKMLSALPIALLLLVRFTVQIGACLALVGATRTPLLWDRRTNALVALRGALHVAGIGAMFLSLRYLPLADAIAIAYVMPFVLLFLGHVAYGEQVGPHRMAAALVGFGGTLLVVRPSFADVGIAALLPVLVAVIFALFMLTTRQVARVAHPLAMQVTGGAVSLALLLPFAAGMSAQMPEGGTLLLLAALGVLGTASHLFLSYSLRFAPASTLAPMQYLEIPVAAAAGWLMFQDFPDGMALAGIAVTVAAGLYVIAREHRAARPAPQAAPPAA